MTDRPTESPSAPMAPFELTRRRLLLGMAASASAAFPLAIHGAAAQASPAAQGTAVPVDEAELQQLIDLSQLLSGGGNFSTERATVLYQLIAADSDLSDGYAQLLKASLVDGQPIEPAPAKTAAEAILIFWYADLTTNGDPLPDRGSAYYQLTSWQAMYTPSWAVCHFYGGWTLEPSDEPIIPAN